MSTEIYIYTAADAFLYLPVYIAKELKIFKSLLKDESISITFPDLKAEGDTHAIQEMLNMNEKAIYNERKNIIPICISDPTAFLSKKISNRYDYTQCIVIGALINKVPFWAVDRHHIHYDSFDKLCESFTDVIHYDKELLTGYHLGQRFMEKNKYCVPHLASKVGSEFQVLDETYKNFISRNEENKSVVALSADIVSVVKGLMEKDIDESAQFSINYYFSKEKDSLISTGILTTKNVIRKKENHRLLCKIIEGIQKSISIIESSEEIATEICLKVANDKKIAAIDKEVARKIIERINDENFYPADLNISKNEWNNTIIALGTVEKWPQNQLNERLTSSYDDYVTNEFLKGSLMEISKQFGITKEVFRNEIDDEINIAIVPLKSELEEIRKKYLPFEKWDKLTIFMGRCQVSIFNFFKRPFIKLEGWKKLLIWFIILSLFASFVTSVIFNEFNLADTNPVISKVMKCILWIVPVIFTIIFAGPTIKDWTKKTKER